MDKALLFTNCHSLIQMNFDPGRVIHVVGLNGITTKWGYEVSNI